MAALGEETAPDLSREGIPKTGDIIAGKYRVERHIGKGGMAVVLAARHVDLGQEVAVKVMHPVVAIDPLPVERFLREAKAAMTIQGEHVVRIIDAGKLEDGLPYMVMEYLTGVDLAELSRKRGPLPIEESVEYILQACEALAEAHAKGIIHRDLKPSNLFLAQRPDGSPLIKVLDFGIAKVIVVEEQEEQLQLTTTGMGMGSPQFMSPEQLRDAKTVDARADVWSLGVVLYQLLTGQAPFHGRTFSSLCASIIADRAIPAIELRPDIPPPLNTLVMRCLEKDVEQRVPNVAELARGLLPYAHSTAALSVTRITKILADGTIAGAAGRASNPSLGMAAALRPAGPALQASSSTLATTVQGKTEPARQADHRFTLLAAIGGALCMGLIVTMIWISRDVQEMKDSVPTTPPQAPESPAAGADSVSPPNVTAAVPVSPATSPPVVAAAPSASASAPEPQPSAPAASAQALPPRLLPWPNAPRPTTWPNKGVNKGDPLDDRK